MAVPTSDRARGAARPTARDLVRESLDLGLAGLRPGSVRPALDRLWTPLDVDRVVELPWAGGAMAEAGRILDISSPKLLACWLARHTPATVVATDLWAAEVEAWRALVAAADPRGRRYGRLALEAADATALPYPDGSFDAAYSVSVIEHIPGDGDAAAVAELARVVRPGGTVAITVPFAPAPRDEFVEADLYGQRYEGEPLFFYRHYSAETLAARLLTGGAFDVAERIMWRRGSAPALQQQMRRTLPGPIARLRPGRFLGPALTVIGLREMQEAPPEEPGAENVIALRLVRR